MGLLFDPIVRKSKYDVMTSDGDICGIQLRGEKYYFESSPEKLSQRSTRQVLGVEGAGDSVS